MWTYHYQLKLTALLLSFFIAAPAISREATESEKYVLHFGISAGFGYLTENFIHEYYDTAEKRVIYATAIAMIPGLGKEVYDELDTTENTHFSEMDLLADAVGAFLGAYTANHFNQKVSVTLNNSKSATLIGFTYKD